MRKFIIGASAIFILISCSAKKPVYVEMKGNMEVVCKNGVTQVIGENDDKFKNLNSWFVRNSEGWSESPASYSHDFVISSLGYTVYVLEDSVVVNSEEGQFIKKTHQDRKVFLSLCLKS